MKYAQEFISPHLCDNLQEQYDSLDASFSHEYPFRQYHSYQLMEDLQCAIGVRKVTDETQSNREKLYR